MPRRIGPCLAAAGIAMAGLASTSAVAHTPTTKAADAAEAAAPVSAPPGSDPAPKSRADELDHPDAPGLVARARPSLSLSLAAVDRRHGFELAPMLAPDAMLALRVPISERSQLSLARSVTAGGEPSARRVASSPQLGFELAPSTAGGLAKQGHLWRLQTDAHTTLALRLRGGRLGLSLQMQFAAAE